MLVLLLNMVFGGGFGQFSVTASVSDISCAYSSEVDMGTSVSAVHAVAGIIYLWLLNPAITYGMLISDRRNRHSGGIIVSNGSGTGGS